MFHTSNDRSVEINIIASVLQAWSPYNISHTDDQAMMTLERCVYTHQEYINLILRNGHFMTHNYTNASMEEDPKMMAFFDSLVQRELEGTSLSAGCPCLCRYSSLFVGFL